MLVSSWKLAALQIAGKQILLSRNQKPLLEPIYENWYLSHMLVHTKKGRRDNAQASN